MIIEKLKFDDVKQLAAQRGLKLLPIARSDSEYLLFKEGIETGAMVCNGLQDAMTKLNSLS